MKDAHPSPLARCIMLTGGDHTAAALLQSILHWSKYGKAIVPGTEGTWVANSQDFWCREVQTSPGQHNRALAKLATARLIEKRQRPFGGRNVLHVRPTQAALDFYRSGSSWDSAHSDLKALAENGSLSLPETTTSKLTKIGDLTLSVLANSNNMNNNHNNHEKQACVEAALHLDAVLISSALEEDYKKEDDHEIGSSTLALMKKGSSSSNGLPNQPWSKKVSGSSGSAKPSVTSLRERWDAKVLSTYGHPITSWTFKALGQLMMFARKCEPHDPGMIIERVIRDWVEFALTAESHAGAFNIPIRPEVGFLLKYVTIAVNFSPAKKISMQYQSVSAPLPKSSPFLELEETNSGPATMEEILAILKG